MFTLYTTPGFGNVPSLSPFCAKLHYYLRLAEVPFREKPADIRKAPRGKIPFAKHEGQVLTDSQQIINYCKQHFGDPLDSALTPRQRTQGHLLRRTIEEATYFPMVYTRWLSEDGFALIRREVGPAIPAPLRPIVLPLIRRKVRTTLVNHGIGRAPVEEVIALAIADFDALAEWLSDKAFALTDKPTSVDATVYGFIQMVIEAPYSDPAIEHARNSKPLVDYCGRMAEWLAKLPGPQTVG